MTFVSGWDKIRHVAKGKFALGLLLLSLLGAILLINPAFAAPDEVKWSRVNIPTEGKGGNWVLADGSDVQHLSMAIDGTLYSYANPSGTSYTLFKSTDDGYSWSYTGEVEDTIVALATAPSLLPVSPNKGGGGEGYHLSGILRP